MQAIREDEDDILVRLETRLEQVTGVIARLRERNQDLEEHLRQALAERDAAREEAKSARAEAARHIEEADSLRTRQREAASRIKNLLSQVEQMNLLED
jgi:chromosome segregation ATPase